MRKKFSLISLALILLCSLSYLLPPPSQPFTKLYERVDPSVSASLAAFRESFPPRYLEVNRTRWEYIVVGEGGQTLLFLHGLTGSYDIWWQQIQDLEDRYRIVAVTYPAEDSLEALAEGILAILDREGVSVVTVIGTSLGGYVAQFLVANYPERIEKAVFSNTFPPNEILKRQYGLLGGLIPYTPEWLIMLVLRANVSLSLYPAGRNSELLRAFLIEQTYGRMSKAQILARYRCVVEPFEPPNLAKEGIPVLIIESDNDPLLTSKLRRQMREVYPTAMVRTLPSAGHFPYLSSAKEYTGVLSQFLTDQLPLQ